MTWAYETEADETVLTLVREACLLLRSREITGTFQRAAMAFLNAHPKPFGEAVRAERKPIHRDHLPRVRQLVDDLATVEDAMEPLGPKRGDCQDAMATLTTEGGTVTLDVDLARDMLSAVRLDIRNELARMGVQT
jgi:hypothetical protein